MAKEVVFIDSEINFQSKKIDDLGAYKTNGEQFHAASLKQFQEFVANIPFVCGHNIIQHDLKYLGNVFSKDTVFIDTLPMSPILFPKKPYHKLLKDDKLESDSANNPLNDSIKAWQLFNDEVNQFNNLTPQQKQIYSALLYQHSEFQGFFKYLEIEPTTLSASLIREVYRGYICENADLEMLIETHPRELAYALAIIKEHGDNSFTPGWVLRNYPKVSTVLHFLCGRPCYRKCLYCQRKFDIQQKLKSYFCYDEFRLYDGEPLQEKAVNAAVNGESILTIFPTGGGKSLTFQLPALMCGENEQGLTVVISPLQSLMKDQVDQLINKGIAVAASINGLLDPIERMNILQRVRDGQISLLYISPEQLRSTTIERLLLSRNIVRFVIDEAHCFSVWGQDFRVDYLYIGDFIKELQTKKGIAKPIPVSCFTATAKQKVISDIKDYFREKLGLELKLFATTATRKNLRYNVLFKENDQEKYTAVRNLIDAHQCPTIVYVSRTRRAEDIAGKLNRDGIRALPFHGQMEPEQKIFNQEAFIKNDVQVVVATSAFGMGVDKKDIGLVIHYDIANSLENYIQEAGRAGRDFSIQAECYILFNNDDLDKHFILLNQTKLSMGDIQNVWRAIKSLTSKERPEIWASPLEIGRKARWSDDHQNEIETRVKTAINALEQAGYLVRGKNSPRVYATSIKVKNMLEAVGIITKTNLLNDEQKLLARRIMSSLISARSVARAGNAEAESRIDYLADNLGVDKRDVICAVNLMRQAGLLRDDHDLTASIDNSDNENKSRNLLNKFVAIENAYLAQLQDDDIVFDLKMVNERIINQGIKCTLQDLKTIRYFWIINHYIKVLKEDHHKFIFVDNYQLLRKKIEIRQNLCDFIINFLFSKSQQEQKSRIDFSLVEILEEYQNQLSLIKYEITLKDIEDAILYLTKIRAMKIEGGFLVIYNSLQIKRIVLDNKIKYKVEDYKQLNDYYKSKIQQIHIVGRYARLMVENYEQAMLFVHDYFNLPYEVFLTKYFRDELVAISRNVTPEKFIRLYGELSPIQAQILNDNTHQRIVVAAGPGSGKTRVLVHKMAALLTLDEVKHEQLLLLTFSRAAATELKKRLLKLTGNATQFVEIKTFHSYAFDLLGRIGNLQEVDDVIQRAIAAIKNGEVEPNQIAKAVIMIDEAQDMTASEFELVQTIASLSDEIKIIAVGDDDQNIYEWRGSDSRCFASLLKQENAHLYQMNENYRSGEAIVNFSNEFIKNVSSRMKTEPGRSKNNHDDCVNIVKYDSPNLIVPVVQDVIKKQHSGKVAVLTATNEEAELVVSLLNEQGKPAKLIQSLDHFNLFDLIEIRYFVQEIDKTLNQSPKIMDHHWQNCIELLKRKFATSTNLNLCLKMLSTFSEINRDKYRSDLERFIRESKLEDFYDDSNQANVVTVSTIHKAKGREFDTVYLLLSNLSLDNDATIRKIYVGLTRAKRELHIHYHGNAFDRFRNTNYANFIYNQVSYPESNHLILPLTLKDVFLDLFTECPVIKKIRAGQKITFDNNWCMIAEIDGEAVVLSRLSKQCIAKLEALQNKYDIIDAEIKFMVYYQKKCEQDGKATNQEILIALPEIKLLKKT